MSKRFKTPAEMARTDFSGLQSYWNDPVARARFDAEIADNRAKIHAAIDKGMEASNQRQRDRWAREEKDNANG